MRTTRPADGEVPLRLDVVALLPERWNACGGCEAMVRTAGLGLDPLNRGEGGYPAEWEERFDELAGLLDGVSRRFGPRVRVRLFDPRTPAGLWYSLRHGVFRTPAFLVEGRRVPGSGRGALGEVIPRIAGEL